MYDVIALGELLIDFTPKGFSEQQHDLYEANPGGAPCNVLSMLNKNGKKTAFIGKVGNDLFGNMLKQTIEKEGISTRGLCMDDDVKTTLAFVHMKEDGDRDFSFYRNPGADMMLSEEDIDPTLFQQCKLFHFGTLSMTHEGVRKATKKAIGIAKREHAYISFDPNLRPPLWENLELAKEQMQYGCSVCDILKIEQEELCFMTGKATIEEGVVYLRNHYAIRLIFVTKGKDGSVVYYNDMVVEKSAYLNKTTIDTTGAGDTFYGMCLAYLLDHDLLTLSSNNLHDLLTYANAAASIITTRHGALCAMPTLEEVKERIALG